MQLALTVDEALALAAAVAPQPPFVTSVRAEGDVVHAEVDLRRLPTASTAVRWAAMAAGTVTVDARLVGWSDGVATFALRTESRSLPLHRLVNALTGTLTGVLRERGLGDLVAVSPGEDEPLVTVQVQRAIDQRASGVVVTHLALRDATVHVTAEVGDVRVLGPGGPDSQRG